MYNTCDNLHPHHSPPPAPFSPTVSIVLVVVGVLAVLLLCSVLLVMVYCCCGTTLPGSLRLQRAVERTFQTQGQDGDNTTNDCVYTTGHGVGGKLESLDGTQEKLPLPPEPAAWAK